jgi:hypothetical protein
MRRVAAFAQSSAAIGGCAITIPGGLLVFAANFLTKYLRPVLYAAMIIVGCLNVQRALSDRILCKG